MLMFFTYIQARLTNVVLPIGLSFEVDEYYVGVEVFTAVTVKNVVFWGEGDRMKMEATSCSETSAYNKRTRRQIAEWIHG
jgi:hypothetical protein